MRALPALLLALLLAACATVPRFEAAGDIHAFLLAVRDGDSPAFEAHVDRPALRNQLRARLIAQQARAHGDQSWQAIGAVLAGPLVGLAADRLVQPDVFRAVAIRLGYDAARPVPSQLQITAGLRLLDPGRVCVAARRDGPCQLVFRNEGGVWRLTEFQGDLREIRTGARA